VTEAGPARHLAAAPAPVVVPRVHADRATYQEWVEQHCTSYAARWDRMKNYDRFVEQWPVLQDWFDAPLRQRLLDKENCVRGQDPHWGASVIMPYLTCLSLVRGVGLDYPVLLARTFTSPFKLQTRHGGLGVMPACSTGTLPGSPSSATPRHGRNWSGRLVGCCCTAATRT